MREGPLIGADAARPGGALELLTLGEAAGRARAYLAERGSESARLDADLLAAHALGIERIAVYTQYERPLTEDERAIFRELLRRRAAGEPMAYILGWRAFRRLVLEVGAGVLVPRPETETVVEWALELARPKDRVLDWGTGSGAIALALADEGEELDITAVDVSEPALEYARRNAERLELPVDLIASDGLDGLTERRFDLVVANPPYLRSSELGSLGPELGFEPEAALVAGESGLEGHAHVLRDAAATLETGGSLLVEIGADQAEDVFRILEEAGFVDIETRQDLAGLDRVVAARKGN